MSKPDNMEDLFKNTFEGFEAKPKNDRWSDIAANLDAEQKKRRFLWIWSGIASVVLLGGVLGLLFFQSPEEPLANQSIPHTPAQPAQPKSAETNEPSPVQGKHTQSRNNSSNPVGNTETKASTGKFTKASSDEESNEFTDKDALQEPKKNTGDPELPIEEAGKNGNPGLQEKPITPTDTPDGTIEVKKKPGTDSEETIEDLKDYPRVVEGNDPAYNLLTDRKLNIGISFSALRSNFIQSRSSETGNYQNIGASMLNDYDELRKQLEKPGFEFRQGFQFEWNLTRRLFVGSGIQLIQTTQYLEFNTVSVANDPLNAPSDFDEGTFDKSNTNYLYEFERITAGDQNRAENKYFSRQIPLYIGYRMPIGNRVAIRAQLGTSFRWTSSANYFVPDIDGIGMLRIQGKDSYPGIKSVWNIDAAVGVDIALGQNYILGINPYFNRAIQSNIAHPHFEEQHQNSYGLQLHMLRTC